MISEAIKNPLSEDYGVEVINVMTESGDDINHTFCISSTDGETFLKCNKIAPNDFFVKRRSGFKILFVPRIYKVGEQAYLLCLLIYCILFENTSPGHRHQFFKVQQYEQNKSYLEYHQNNP